MTRQLHIPLKNAVLFCAISLFGLSAAPALADTKTEVVESKYNFVWDRDKNRQCEIAETAAEALALSKGSKFKVSPCDCKSKVSGFNGDTLWKCKSSATVFHDDQGVVAGLERTLQKDLLEELAEQQELIESTLEILFELEQEEKGGKLLRAAGSAISIADRASEFRDMLQRVLKVQRTVENLQDDVYGTLEIIGLRGQWSVYEAGRLRSKIDELQAMISRAHWAPKQEKQVQKKLKDNPDLLNEQLAAALEEEVDEPVAPKLASPRKGTPTSAPAKGAPVEEAGTQKARKVAPKDDFNFFPEADESDTSSSPKSSLSDADRQRLKSYQAKLNEQCEKLPKLYFFHAVHTTTEGTVYTYRNDCDGDCPEGYYLAKADKERPSKRYLLTKEETKAMDKKWERKVSDCKSEVTEKLDARASKLRKQNDLGDELRNELSN